MEAKINDEEVHVHVHLCVCVCVCVCSLCDYLICHGVIIILLSPSGVQESVFRRRLHGRSVRPRAQEVSPPFLFLSSFIFCIICISVSIVFQVSLHAFVIITMPRTHYRRQKRWWSAYLLFYDRADQCPVFDGKAACLYIHVHVGSSPT